MAARRQAGPSPPPYGGRLVDGRVNAPSNWRATSNLAAGIVLEPADLIGLHNLADGFYSPLDGFMNEGDYRSVLERGRLQNGLEWTIPIVLPVAPEVAGKLRVGRVAGLRDGRGRPIGALTVGSIFRIHPREHARRVFGTVSLKHPGVRDVLAGPHVAIGGRVAVWAAAPAERGVLVRTPREMRKLLAQSGRTSFTAFSTRNVGHLGHEHLQNMALEVTGLLAINIIVGAARPGSFRADIVARVYREQVRRRYPRRRVILNAMRLPPINAGPREAVLQAIVMQNLGFTHFIVGRDHAGFGGFYKKYSAQAAVAAARDLDITVLPFAEPFFCSRCGRVASSNTCRHAAEERQSLNGTDLRELLRLYDWDGLSRLVSADVLDVLREMSTARPVVSWFHS